MVQFTASLAAVLLAANLVNAGPIPGSSSTDEIEKRTSTTGKRGICYNNAAWSSLFGGSGTQVTWQYNWDSSDPGRNTALGYPAMLWNDSSIHTTNWVANANAAIAAGTASLLSFNEPELAKQANMSPADAAAAYKKYMQPFAGRVRLGGPAISNGPDGIPWLKEFNSLCTGCTIDFQPMHWYDSATNYAYFTSYLKQVAAAIPAGRNLWLTEFAGSGTAAQQVTFLQTVMPWLDAQSWIERYSYYGVFEGSLVQNVNGKEQRTALGNTFNTYYSTQVTIS